MILIAIPAVLAWLAILARWLRSNFLKCAGVGLAVLLAAVVATMSAVIAAGLHTLNSRDAPVRYLNVAGTPEQIQRGQAIVDSFCGACHSKTGTLTGGTDIGKEFPISVGSFMSSNLTPAGSLKHWSDGAIFRAIRNSIDADGHWLIVMSYTNAGKLSDDDIESVIAYIRSRPPVGQVTANPPDKLNLLGLILLGAGKLPRGNSTFTGVITAPPKGPTARYGEYILSYQDCRQCHGLDLSGGVEGQLGPIGPDLNLVKEWTLDEFIATLRTGIDPGGYQLSERMPWRPIGKMDDEELAAVYDYLTHLPQSRSGLR
jgi:mono/diheme cytochrome c family protein